MLEPFEATECASSVRTSFSVSTTEMCLGRFARTTPCSHGRSTCNTSRYRSNNEDNARASHHNAYLQVFPAPNGQSRVLWVTDLLPDEMRAPIEQMVELGSAAMAKTLERSFVAIE